MVTGIKQPKKTTCCRYSMVQGVAAYSKLAVGDEIIKIGRIPVALSGQDALDHALRSMNPASKSMWILRKRVPQGKTGSSKKAMSRAEQAVGTLTDEQRTSLRVSEVKRSLTLLKKASVHTVRTF